MNLEFYSIPLRPDVLMRQEEHLKCTLKQSVAQYLHLIITSAFGEIPADEDFGCSIWDYDFDNITSVHKLNELIKQSLTKSVQQYEKRLYNIKVELMVRQEELKDNLLGHRVKKRMDITITGQLQSTNEHFIYTDSFFTGPLSYKGN
jgi:phage baseplate assembly protein W